MTEENYKYRTSPLFLRNQFEGKGNFKIPIIPKFKPENDDFDNLRLIGFDKTNLEDHNYLNRMVHFFLYDYKFERVWKNPDTDIEKLKRYRAVFTPDFSMYADMAPVMQLYNTFRNRWCGSYFASKGIRVIPTVSWGNENTFEFSFDGIEKGSVVAVSTYMVSAHNNHSDQKAFFMKGYNQLLRRVEPEKIICYNEPFSEMQGDIVFVDYDLSSWRYMNDEPYVPSKYVKYFGTVIPKCNSIKIMKTAHIMQDIDHLEKGMGNSRGGNWRPSPNKPDDKRFLGKPEEIIRTRSSGKKGGYDRETKIGKDGKAIKERHKTDHDQPWAHSNPHDHEINWESGNPRPGPSINYPNGNIPEFKIYMEVIKNMDESIILGKDVNLNFESINDFKWCMRHGGEVEFSYHEKSFSITPRQSGKIGISEAFKQETERLYDTPDEVLEYLIDGVRLRDMITEIEVIDRTI